MKRIHLFVIAFTCLAIAVSAQPKDAVGMSCKIKGRIVAIEKPQLKDKSPCAKYSCKAKVKLVEVYSCGPAVAQTLNSGETVEVEFAYTLSPTNRIFPTMKTHYPGMKKNDVFTANVEQRLLPGGAVRLLVYDYHLKH